MELSADKTALQSTIANLQQDLEGKERDYEEKLVEFENGLDKMEGNFTEKAMELDDIQHQHEVEEVKKEALLNQLKVRIKELEKVCTVCT